MIYSVGHSTHSQEAFLKIINGKISTLIDVRSHPGSKWPQFQRENLERWLPEAGIRYEWEPRLGGWDKRHLPLVEEMRAHRVDISCYARGKFPKQRISIKTLPSEADARQEFLPIVKPFWWNQGLLDYSWFMSIPEFLEGAKELIERSQAEDIAIMCCEGPYYKCHRSMIADYLVWSGSDCQHIPGKKMHSQMIGNRLERYELDIIKKWQNHATI